MNLILDLIGPPRLMGARNRFELTSGSATIGRSPEADWVIPDLNRMISRRHLRIDSSGNDFTLTDTSSNGVYVNGSDVPIGYGASVTLRHGDRLRVGEAEIAVAIDGADDDARGGPSRRGAAPEPRPPSNAPRDPLGGPFAASAVPPAAAAKAGGAEIIDANWMIQPDAAPAPRSSDAGREPYPYEAGRDARDRVAPSSVASLLDRHPGLSARRLADAIDAAAREMDAATWQVLYERVAQLLRPQA